MPGPLQDMELLWRVGCFEQLPALGDWYDIILVTVDYQKRELYPLDTGQGVVFVRTSR